MLEQPTAQKTIVAFLLDRTGSMDAIKTETIGGFNAYLDTLQRDAGELIEFTMLQFDSQAIDTLYLGAKLSDVCRLTAETYQPRAYTPLIDACVKTIMAVEENITQRRDKPRVIVAFQTDGEENASREHSLGELRDLIARRKAEGWMFVFLGANIDAYRTARKFGIGEDATVAYRGEFSSHALEETAAVFANYAKGKARRVGFSAQQKHRAGDHHAADSATLDMTKGGRGK